MKNFQIAVILLALSFTGKTDSATICKVKCGVNNDILTGEPYYDEENGRRTK
jgi:hypothetical protein